MARPRHNLRYRPEVSLVELDGKATHRSAPTFYRDALAWTTKANSVHTLLGATASGPRLPGVAGICLLHHVG